MERVRKLRIETGVNQMTLATLLGLCQTNYCKMERGRLVPPTIKETEERAIKILKPLLAKKLIEAQSEVERLESLLTQYK